ncbi:MAG: hypothetical protein ACREQR_03940 [Candidatus Binataceae bacterium]
MRALPSGAYCVLRRMLLREAWNVGQSCDAINWFRRENAHPVHIFIHSHGSRGLNLIDDLS